jgi:hypothetical protein
VPTLGLPGADDPARRTRARELLDADPALARTSIYTAAAVGDAPAARELLADDPARATAQGGPYAWEPLLYLTYSRLLTTEPGRSAIAVARLLLEHGADPNAGYLWEGLVPPFTALTGVFGDGGGDPPAHRDWQGLARLLLEAGADANDGQALYNLRGDPDDRWLERLLEFGLGTGDGGPWRRLLGEAGLAAGHARGRAHGRCASRLRRSRTPAARPWRGPRGQGARHPIYEGRRPVQEAALWGRTDVVSMLVDAGASGERDDVDTLLMMATAGDREAVDRLLAAGPGVRERAIERHPDQLVRAAENNSAEAVALLIELGFDVNAVKRTAALHEAAMRGNLAIIELLLEHGADPNVRDVGYNATPAGWAEHHGQREAHRYLAALEQRGDR